MVVLAESGFGINQNEKLRYHPDVRSGEIASAAGQINTHEISVTRNFICTL